MDKQPDQQPETPKEEAKIQLKPYEQFLLSRVPQDQRMKYYACIRVLNQKKYKGEPQRIKTLLQEVFMAGWDICANFSKPKEETTPITQPTEGEEK